MRMYSISVAFVLSLLLLFSTTAVVVVVGRSVESIPMDVPHMDDPLVRLFSLWDSNSDGRVDRMEMARYVLQFQENDEWEHVGSDELPDILETERWVNRDGPRSIEFAWSQMTHALFSRPVDSFTYMELFAALRSNNSNPLNTRITTCGDEQPQQLHIAPGQRNVDMTVMWTTKNKQRNPRGSRVQYGRDPKKLNLVVDGVSDTYDVGELAGWSGWLHRAVLSDLEPNTVYYYRVGTDAPMGLNGTAECWSAVNRFRSLSDDPQRQKYPAKIAFYGDMGTVMPMGFAVTQALIYDHERAGAFDMIHHIGDIAYAGTGRTWEFEFIWDAFMRQVQPLAQSVPYVVGVGNHEKYYNFTAYIHRYHTRGNLEPQLGQKLQQQVATKSSTSSSIGHQDKSVRNFYYSFDSYGIHWIHMCTEQYAYPMTPGSAQYQWLESDLQRAVENRHNVPWIVLMGHRSMYNSDSTSDFPGGAFQTNIEPLMLKYNVDFGLYGHWHMYERTLPVRHQVAVPEGVSADRRRYVNVKAPIHITVGNAGARIKDNLVHPQPAWSVHRALQFGYSRLTVHNATSLHFEHIGASKFTVLDSFWVHKF